MNIIQVIYQNRQRIVSALRLAADVIDALSDTRPPLKRPKANLPALPSRRKSKAAKNPSNE